MRYVGSKLAERVLLSPWPAEAARQRSGQDSSSSRSTTPLSAVPCRHHATTPSLLLQQGTCLFLAPAAWPGLAPHPAPPPTSLSLSLSVPVPLARLSVADPCVFQRPWLRGAIAAGMQLHCCYCSTFSYTAHAGHNDHHSCAHTCTRWLVPAAACLAWWQSKAHHLRFSLSCQVQCFPNRCPPPPSPLPPSFPPLPRFFQPVPPLPRASPPPTTIRFGGPTAGRGRCTAREGCQPAAKTAPQADDVSGKATCSR